MKARVRALIGDPDGDFCTDAYVVPLINQAYDEAINELAGTCSPFMTRLLVAPNLPAGIADLAEQQEPGGPLDGLMTPLKIEYKQAGLPESSYRFAEEAGILPNVSPIGGGLACRPFWEWRSWIVYLTPLNYAADFRVRGEYRPPALIKDKDYIAVHPLMVVALAYATGVLIGMERGNKGYVADYTPKAEKTLNDISAELVRKQQSTSSRVGRMGDNRNRGRGRG